MKKKNTLRVLVTVFLLIIFSVLVILFSSSWLDKRVKSRLESEFQKQSHGNYELTIDALRLNILTMSVSIKGISVIPVKKHDGAATYRFSTKEINLNGVGVLRFITNKNLKVNKVSLVEPSIKITKGKSRKIETDTTNQFSLYGFVRTFAKSVTLDNITVIDFDLLLYSKKEDDTPSLHSNSNSFRIRNFHIGPSTAKLPGYFEADTIVLSMKRFTYTQPDSLYTFSVGQLNASFRDSLLLIDSISFSPNFSKKNFGNVVGKQTDRFDIQAKKLVLRNIDLRSFLEQHDLISRSGEIDGFAMVSHRDKNDLRERKQPPSLQKILRDAPLYFNIDTLKIKNAIAIYEEVEKGNISPGRITFKNINGKFTGITNDSLLISSGAELIFTASCNFMDEGNLQAAYRIPLNTELTDFDCSGILTKMPLSTLNKVLEPLAGISIKDGHLDTLKFSFHAGEEASNGTVDFRYHDLDLGLSDKGPKEIGTGDRLKMFFANNFVIINDNPEKGKSPRTAKIHFIRNKQRFMFNYTWKSLFSGISETVGIPEDKKL